MSIIEIGDALKKGYDAILDLLDQLNWAKRTLNDISEHKPITPREDKWKDFISKYSLAADGIGKSDFISRFDPSHYPVSAEEFIMCRTRRAAVSKLNGYLAELRSGIDEANVLDGQFDDMLREADTSAQVVREIIELYERLIKVPGLPEEINNAFLWDWYDLNVSIAPAVGRLKSALDSRKRRLANEKTLIATKASNLEGNLADLIKIPCRIDGTWNGTNRFPNSLENQSNTFSNDGAGGYKEKQLYAGGVSYDACYVSVDTTTRYVEFRRWCGQNYQWTWSLRLNEDFTAMTGTAVRSDHPHYVAQCIYNWDGVVTELALESLENSSDKTGGLKTADDVLTTAVIE